MNRRWFFCLYIALCLTFSGLPLRGGENGDANLIAAPILFYTPETTLSMGAAGTLALQLGETGLTHPSTISSAVYFTLNKQVVGNLKSDIYLSGNRINLQGFFEYRKYPDKFFGIGNQTLPTDATDFTLKSWEFSHTAQIMVLPDLYLGGVFRYYNWMILEPKDEPLPPGDLLEGTGQKQISGLGVQATWDSRNRIFTPHQGWYLKVQGLFYHSGWGSDYNFSNLQLDLRKYLPGFFGHVLALRLYLEGNMGDPPFLTLPKVGGSRLMRGYYTGRYRDSGLYALQAEYRVPLFWRVGMVLFGALGNVVPGPGDLLLHEVKYSVGVGIRYTFNRDKGMTLRLDQGFTGSDSATYLEAFEAF